MHPKVRKRAETVRRRGVECCDEVVIIVVVVVVVFLVAVAIGGGGGRCEFENGCVVSAIESGYNNARSSSTTSGSGVS